MSRNQSTLRTLYRHLPAGPPRVAAILFLGLFAGQSGQLALTPVLADAARAFGVSTAAAGQIRTAAAVVAAVSALVAGALAGRVRLRTLLQTGVFLLVVGSGISFAATSIFVLAAGQALIGAASSILVSSGVAAAAAWSDDRDRGRVVAWTLVGAPSAWVVAMPVIGVVAGVSWRFAFVFPVVAGAVATAALRRAPAVSTPRSEGGLLQVLAERALRGWAIGELLAYAAWSGVLVYAGALFVESYGASLVSVGAALGLGAAAYIPGTFVAQRLASPGRPPLAAAGLLLAACVVVFGVLRPGVVPSAICFGVLCFIAGARTFLGSAVGLDLAADRRAGAMSIRAAAAQVGWILGAALGGIALSTGGYPALGLALAALFVAASVVHLPAIVRIRRQGCGSATPRARLRPAAASRAR